MLEQSLSQLGNGGPVVYLLGACSIFALAIIMERLVSWMLEGRRMPLSKLVRLVHAIETNDKASVGSLIKNKPQSHIFVRVVDAYEEGGLEKVVTCIHMESESAYTRTVQFLGGLETVVSIAPLLGILGTVLGIMKSFQGLDLQNLQMSGAMSQGLSEAMITTVVGLMIAVPCLIVFNLFSAMALNHASKIARLADELQYRTTPSSTVESPIRIHKTG